MLKVHLCLATGCGPGQTEIVFILQLHQADKDTKADP